MLVYGSEINNNYIIKQQGFSNDEIAKFESIFCQGNGSMGVRAALEESYESTVRNTFVAGVFNTEHSGEVAELVNIPDLFNFNLQIDGQRLNLNELADVSHERVLDMQSALVTRSIGHQDYQIAIERFVSMTNKNVLAQQVELRAERDMTIEFSYCIDGRVSNSGSQNLYELDRRIIANKTLCLTSVTTNSNKLVNCQSTLTALIDGQDVLQGHSFKLERRRPVHQFKVQLLKGQELCLRKVASVSVDCAEPKKLPEIELVIANANAMHLERVSDGYPRLKQDHCAAWQEIWRRHDLKIDGNDFDQLAIRFAIYHMIVMTPTDGLSGIGAKGLSGEGYKGHSFWDTEIFLQPFFNYSNPAVARALINYRINTLKGAQINAAKDGFKGAMFPWESADTGADVTPKWGPLDVESGRPIEVLCGFLEQHVTADVAFALYDFYKQTNDESLMMAGGYKLIFETAKFWASRMTWNDEFKQYTINGIIGPDEYTEKVDNNAYTNFLVKTNLEFALKLYQQLAQQDALGALNYPESATLAEDIQDIEHKLASLRVQQVNSAGVIPQDDTYLSLPEFDAAPYKGIGKVGSVLKDYNIEQLSGYQVGKQADVVMLFHMFPELWSRDVVEKCWEYYEQRCIHDSSLSYSIYASVAARIGKVDIAYQMFKNSSMIDLCDDMHSSDEGIHAASFGGMWQSIVKGFCGVRIEHNQLIIDPNLPSAWQKLEFNLCWQQATIKVEIGEKVNLTLVDGPMPSGEVRVKGESHSISASLDTAEVN